MTKVVRSFFCSKSLILFKFSVNTGRVAECCPTFFIQNFREIRDFGVVGEVVY